jgi:beta-1,4-mannosyl-glycoprotein beta-1,4-N-acetylglucosaminyltransferase
MGGLEKILYKINSFAHTEFNKDEYKDPEKIKFYMKNGIDLFTKEKKYKVVEIDDTFPSYIQKNKEKFKDLILS